MNDKIIEEPPYTVGYTQPCKGCGRHDSMWKSLVESPEWRSWYKYQTGGMQEYDVDECQELGIMSAPHFRDFMNHFLSQARQSALEEALGCVPGEYDLSAHNFVDEEGVLEWDKPRDIADYFQDKGSNICRTQTIENIRKLMTP